MPSIGRRRSLGSVSSQPRGPRVSVWAMGADAPAATDTAGRGWATTPVVTYALYAGGAYLAYKLLFK